MTVKRLPTPNSLDMSQIEFASGNLKIPENSTATLWFIMRNLVHQTLWRPTTKPTGKMHPLQWRPTSQQSVNKRHDLYFCNALFNRRRSYDERLWLNQRPKATRKANSWTRDLANPCRRRLLQAIQETCTRKYKMHRTIFGCSTYRRNRSGNMYPNDSRINALASN